ncbi:C-terminal helicase domain-containing protein [Bradyrhizobium canariense]|uniref:C-terminal helicase domain-containing protein n=1 Tax=Bradyrhizobium canariense TaxID=255045 RepID=UPI00289FBA7D|nr:C-terminal helicase domain-containing protein [Bradyrhizobium canariense]
MLRRIETSSGLGAWSYEVPARPRATRSCSSASTRTSWRRAAEDAGEGPCRDARDGVSTRGLPCGRLCGVLSANIAPYNAQVFEPQERLPGARIGTVDKFQGQEAPIVIYSMTTSSHLDAPRGMEFLYSANRLNVATSRANCLCIVVACPRLLEVECRTPARCNWLSLLPIPRSGAFNPSLPASLP